MNRLHSGNYAQLAKSRNVIRVDMLRMLNAEAEVFGIWILSKRCLVSIQNLLIGAVADGVHVRRQAGRRRLREQPLEIAGRDRRVVIALLHRVRGAVFGLGPLVLVLFPNWAQRFAAWGVMALSGLFAASILLLVALFFTDLLRNLPQPVLAAIVLMAVASLVKVKTLQRYWHVHRGEFFVAMTALAGVLWAGLLKGVLVGAVISLVLLIRRVSRPHVAFLGRIPGARRYSDLERHADNEPIPGVLAFRVAHAL